MDYTVSLQEEAEQVA